MTMHIDCETCPAKPRACGDCSIGLLLSQPDLGSVSGMGLHQAIEVFAGAGMLPGLRVLPELHKRAG